MPEAELDTSCPEWIVEIQVALGCVDHNTVRTGSICRIDKILEAESAKYKKGHKSSYNYKPGIVAMGPFHRGTSRSDLQIMEQTKWRYTKHLLSSSTEDSVSLVTIKSFSERMKELICIIRASYGEQIEMISEELSRMMLLDACFLLEFLLRLCDVGDRSGDPLLEDEKMMLRVLTDLTLLENQIPFVLLQTLSSQIISLSPSQSQRKQQLSERFLVNNDKTFSPKRLAKSLFEIVVSDDDSSQGVYHFLHFIHLCSPDPYKKRDIYSKDQVKLEHCAGKLRAFGITIKASSNPADSQVNGETGSNRKKQVVSALTKFMDNFQFEIDYDDDKEELTISTLHINEATEVKWRNLIAWEQLRLTGIGYKFTSYAHFFKGLVFSVHDIQLLKKHNIIKVHAEVPIKDEDLVTMFQSITIGVEHIDGRYKEKCEKLKKAIKMKKRDVVGYCTCVLPFRMVWHYLWRAWEWLRYRFLSFLQRIIDIYEHIPGKIIAFFVGAAILALTITQTIYAVRAGKH